MWTFIQRRHPPYTTESRDNGTYNALYDNYRKFGKLDNHIVGPRGGYYRKYHFHGPDYLNDGQTFLSLPNWGYYKAVPKRTNDNTGLVNFKGRPIMRTKRGRTYVAIDDHKLYKYSTRRNEPTGEYNFKGRPIIKPKRGLGRYVLMVSKKTGRPYHKFIHINRPGFEVSPGYIKSRRSGQYYYNPYQNTTFVNTKGRTLHRDRKGNFVFTDSGRRTRKFEYPPVSYLPPEIWNIIRSHM